MKRTITSAILTLSACVALVFAAKPPEDPCTKKHTECTDKCENEFRNCKARQTPVDQCEQRKNLCVNKCDQDKQECEKTSGKGGKTTGSPSPTPGKKR